MIDAAVHRMSKLVNMQLVAAISLSTAGYLFYNIMPVFLGSLQDSYGLSNAQIGFIGSSFFVGFNIGGASAFFWVRKLAFRTTAAVSCSFFYVTLIAALINHEFVFLLGTILGLGVASGALAAIGTTVVADFEHSTKWLGVKVAMECFAGTLLLFILPVTLVAMYGYSGSVYGMMISCAVLFSTLFSLSGRVTSSPRLSKSPGVMDLTAEPAVAERLALRPVPGERRSKTGAVLALVALGLFFAGGSAVWAFAERIGADAALAPGTVGLILGVSLIFASIGALVVGPLGGRCGVRVTSVIYAVFSIVGVAFMVLASTSVLYYAMGAALFMVGWGGCNPLLCAKVVQNDVGGRLVSQAVPAIGVGSVIGPALGGLVFGSEGVVDLRGVAILLIASSALLCLILPGTDRTR